MGRCRLQVGIDVVLAGRANGHDRHTVHSVCTSRHDGNRVLGVKSPDKNVGDAIAIEISGRDGCAETIVEIEADHRVPVDPIQLGRKNALWPMAVTKNYRHTSYVAGRIVHTIVSQRTHYYVCVPVCIHVPARQPNPEPVVNVLSINNGPCGIVEGRGQNAGAPVGLAPKNIHFAGAARSVAKAISIRSSCDEVGVTVSIDITARHFFPQHIVRGLTVKGEAHSTVEVRRFEVGRMAKLAPKDDVHLTRISANCIVHASCRSCPNDHVCDRVSIDVTCRDRVPSLIVCIPPVKGPPVRSVE
mmetsp:Transcript_12352/g.30097  ORF Transcript_12352/g.30097 Transcript_12352/m.30097 type:complete len:301 (+) Transcript_12352:2893-3795(+)